MEDVVLCALSVICYPEKQVQMDLPCCFKQFYLLLSKTINEDTEKNDGKQHLERLNKRISLVKCLLYRTFRKQKVKGFIDT